MYIKNILYYDDLSGEADIIVTDGTFDLICFAWNFESEVGDTSFTLTPFECSDVMTSEDTEYLVQKLEGERYEYKLQGKLIDVEKDIGTVQIGGIIIKDIRYIPKDIKIGEYVEFKIFRMELDIEKP